jgi:hypothetical protein
LENHLNIILPSVPRSSRWSLPSSLPTKSLIHFTCIFLLLQWGWDYVSCYCGCQSTECPLTATVARGYVSCHCGCQWTECPLPRWEVNEYGAVVELCWQVKTDILSGVPDVWSTCSAFC